MPSFFKFPQNLEDVVLYKYVNVFRSSFLISLYFSFLFRFNYFSPIVPFCFPLPLFLILLSNKLNDALLRISFMLEVTGSNLRWKINSSELGFTWYVFPSDK
jgi:hypothetical protein